MRVCSSRIQKIEFFFTMMMEMVFETRTFNRWAVFFLFCGREREKERERNREFLWIIYTIYTKCRFWLICFIIKFSFRVCVFCEWKLKKKNERGGVKRKKIRRERNLSNGIPWEWYTVRGHPLDLLGFSSKFWVSERERERDF